MGNALNTDLHDKVVVLSSKYYRGTEEERTVIVTGGFGASPDTIGQALCVTFLDGGESCRAEGFHVAKLADKQFTPKQLEEWKKAADARNSLQWKHMEEIDKFDKEFTAQREALKARQREEIKQLLPKL